MCIYMVHMCIVDMYNIHCMYETCLSYICHDIITTFPGRPVTEASTCIYALSFRIDIHTTLHDVCTCIHVRIIIYCLIIEYSFINHKVTKNCPSQEYPLHSIPVIMKGTKVLTLGAGR